MSRAWSRSSVLVALIGTIAVVSAPFAYGANPVGSRDEVILETGQTGPSGDPGNAVVQGWWGHEGPHGNAATYPSVVLPGAASVNSAASARAAVAAMNSLMADGGNAQDLRVAFVPASPDGSTERPYVHDGEAAGDAFRWWSDLQIGSGISGTTLPNDSVTFVSTQAQWSKFWKAGRPPQNFDRNLVLHDTSNQGAPSATPEGTSILNTWPAGTLVSLVVYVSSGYNGMLEPTVKAGPDGRALSAWLTFRTAAKPGDPVRTSAGYNVVTASAGEGSKLRNGLPVSNPMVITPAEAAASSSAHPSAGSSMTASGHSTPGSSPSSRTSATPGSPTSIHHGVVHQVLTSGWAWLAIVAALAAGGWYAVRRLRTVS